MAKNKGNCKIVIEKNGPYLVSGSLPLAAEIIVCDSESIPVKWDKGKRYPLRENYSLCRCGKSGNAPYCDGTHAKTGFDGTETASRKKYWQQAKKIAGPTLVLTDVPNLCALARFCEKASGVWQLTVDSGDPKARKLAIEEACNCPSGRLVEWDRKTEKPIEKKLKPSISLVEDPEEKASGPIWVKGGVPIVSSDGKTYEIRNRVTLCRCGRSRNKPFCNGTHLDIEFTDGDESLKPGKKSRR